MQNTLQKEIAALKQQLHNQTKATADAQRRLQDKVCTIGDASEMGHIAAPRIRFEVKLDNGHASSLHDTAYNSTANSRFKDRSYKP